MKMIPTKMHGFLDYVSGFALLAGPAGLHLDSAAAQVPFALGIATLIYSLLTRYEWGLIKVLPMRAHLGLDFFNGLFLASSPWIFGFAATAWKPHFFFGLFELAVVLLSRSAAPADLRSPRRVAHGPV
jgi:hypothetical protein